MSEPDPRGRRRFLVCATATVAIIYALILVGGIVRATGSGMGCPDWPTCFGRWIPPLTETELPADYQRIYADRGYADTRFNAAKTWTEYLNRLLGVATGLAIFVTLVTAWSLRRARPVVPALAAAAFVLVGVQGWLGSRVVASNLAPGMITLHMLLAQLIVALLIAALLRAAGPSRERGGADRAGADAGIAQARAVAADTSVGVAVPTALVLGALVLGLAQMVIGTQVREAVDIVARAAAHAERHLWIESLPFAFALHKWLAVPLVAVSACLVWSVLARVDARLPRALAIALALLTVAAATVGTAMERLHVPMFAQPLHLWFGSLTVGAQLALALTLREVAASRRREEGPAAAAAARSAPQRATRAASPPGPRASTRA